MFWNVGKVHVILKCAEFDNVDVDKDGGEKKFKTICNYNWQFYNI